MCGGVGWVSRGRSGVIIECVFLRHADLDINTAF
jgi:hypothetical protein